MGGRSVVGGRGAYRRGRVKRHGSINTNGWLQVVGLKEQSQILLRPVSFHRWLASGLLTRSLLWMGSEAIHNSDSAWPQELHSDVNSWPAGHQRLQQHLSQQVSIMLPQSANKIIFISRSLVLRRSGCKKKTTPKTRLHQKPWRLQSLQTVFTSLTSPLVWNFVRSLTSSLAVCLWVIYCFPQTC